MVTWIGSLSAWYLIYGLALIPLTLAGVVAVHRRGSTTKKAVLLGLATGAGVFFGLALIEPDRQAGLKLLYLFVSVLASVS